MLAGVLNDLTAFCPVYTRHSFIDGPLSYIPDTKLDLGPSSFVGHSAFYNLWVFLDGRDL